MGTCPGSNGVFRFEIALPVSEELCLQAEVLFVSRRKKERKKEEVRKIFDRAKAKSETFLKKVSANNNVN